jgi:regulator of RNase E activity RraA
VLFILGSLDLGKRSLRLFRVLPTAIVADAMNRFNVMDSGIKPLHPGVKICGPALTVREMVGCNIMLHKAIQIAEKGDVIVVDVGGYVNRAVGGYIVSLAAKVKGVEGIVVDGAWRDLEDIRRERPLPIFARAVTPAGPHKGYGGDINITIQCGGVSVSPGDIIIGDEDGVVVVPKDEAEEVLKRARELLAKEREIIEKVKLGISTVEIYGFDEKLRTLGVKVV